MNILTACDSGFFHCLIGLAQSVRRFYGKPLILYDLGLSEEQRQNIDAEIRRIDLQIDYLGYIKHDNVDFIKTTHKPFCIKHYFENSSEPVIYADADCLFLERIEISGFDVGVTVKPRRKRNIKNYYNGIINAGIIFFNRYPEMLIDKWIKKCSVDSHTDQSALAEILSETIDWKQIGKVYDWHGIPVKTLPIEIYNDYNLRNGKILHFKGERHNPFIYEQLLKAIDDGEDVYTRFKELTQKRNPFFRKFKNPFSKSGL